MRIAPRSMTLATACVLAVWAQDAKLPTVESIVENYVKAVGARTAKRVTTRYGKGTFDMPAAGMKGVVELYSKSPNKMFMKVDVPGFGVVLDGYDGTTAWTKNPAQGLREKAGVELALAKRQAEFDKDLKLKELYPKMVLKGAEKIGDRDVYVVEATPTEGAPEIWYFDKATNLMARMTMEMEGPMGKMTIVSDLEDYRDVDGYKMPATIKQQLGPMTMTLRLDEIKGGVPVEDSMFKKPAE